jgi:2-hydroxycyclohexanecarboxyl-CoA dehydrogenase
MGKSIVITGAGRGIGRATALRLASAGFEVAVWDLDAGLAAETADEVSRSGARAFSVSCDVADRSAVTRAARATIEALGVPWGLVNNAGMDVLSVFKDSNPDDWRRIIDVNLFGTLNVTHALIGEMIEAPLTDAGRGRIVCISSDAARVGSTGEGVYAASKAGVLGFMKTLAREVARYAICVNAVCPGPTDTVLLDAVRQGPKGDRIMDAMAKAVPLGRIARPEDIAGAVSFFFSEDAGYVTGQTLSVSGGLTMA